MTSASAKKPVNLPETKQTRLVSAGAGVTELILALGAAPQLVGIDSTSQIPAKLAPSMTQVQRLGYHRMLSAEGIIGLNPSHVIGSEVMGPESSLHLLTQANIHVIKLNSATTEQQLMDNIDSLSEIVGKPSSALELKRTLKQQLAQIADKRSQLTSKPKVLFLLLQEGRPARVGGKDTAADLIITLAGGANAADFDSYKSVSGEGILALNPEVILLSHRSEQSMQATAALFDEVTKQIPLVAHTKAGQQQAFINLKPEALIGGLGLSAIDAADTLVQQFLVTQEIK
ncbi:heme/hemin ABC transporter substrate-binding protein [Shewanella denitrificans]|uniref:heme/hemin ABC transporter substrate-binding protein n=1 Tax=Shewanella denitrificans TaxID=192073 RepID=UPI001E3DB9DC|nr:ABC transporter substrate-binding protein [Shewanella denitrificans]